jgi:aryl-alcohol dehydrogenase-like predicted oxidoreductase
VTTWRVVGGGILSGKYNKKNAPSDGRAAQQNAVSENDLELAAEVVKVAEEIGRTPSQVALNWVRQKSDILIPIIGARTVSQVEDNLGCLDFTLTNKQMSKLDDLGKIELGFPHDFLAKEHIKDIVYGGTLSKIYPKSGHER